jgi:uncharacterized protein YxeA
MKRVIILVAAVLVLAVCGAATWYVTQKDKFNESSSDTTQEQPYDYPETNDSSENIDTSLEGYRDGKMNLDQTEDKLRDEEASAPADQKADYGLARVGLYSEAGRINEALALALQVDADYKTDETAATVAALYEAKKDYANAAKYYQIAADRTEKTTDSTQRSPYNDYMVSKRNAESKL